MTKKTAPLVAVAVILSLIGPAAAAPDPKVQGVYERSHFYAAEASPGQWIRYHLVAQDNDLLSLSTAEAEALLRLAFSRAGERSAYPSAAVELRAASGGTTVFGRAYQSPGQAVQVDVASFEIHKAGLRLALKAQKEVLEGAGSFMEMILNLLRRHLDEAFRQPAKPSPKPPAGGEIEL